MKKLTENKKLEAVALKYYQHHEWIPEVGHYYTTLRSDLELYRITSINDGKITIEYVDGGAIETFDLDGFTNKGFGKCRLWVPGL